MSVPSTNEEWAKIIDEITKEADQARGENESKPAISSSSLTAKSLAKTIDHTLLKLDATEEQVTQLCDEAKEYDFASVCVRLNFVPHAVSQLKGTGVDVACVIGFHEGSYPTEAKILESRNAIDAGARELDMVLNRVMLRAPDYALAFEELKAIRDVAPPKEVTLKLILETALLSREEVVAAVVVAGYAGWDFVKTSTGFNGRGASVEDVVLMGAVSRVVAGKLGEGRVMKVKASGGVRSLEDARRMLDAGAERIGASAGVAIVKEFLGKDGGSVAPGGY